MTVASRATLRPFRGPEDVPALVEIWNAMAVADGIHERRSVEQMTVWYRSATPHFDPWRDIILAEIDGAPRGWVRHSWVDTSDGLRDHRVWVFIGPDHRDLMPLLQDAGEMRAAEAAREQGPIERDRILSTFAMPTQRWRSDELERRGYRIVRWAFEMLRPTLDDIHPAPLPPGLEVRPMSRDRTMLKRLWDADIEAFADHWGGFDGSDEAFEEWLDEPTLDPSLFVVAWDRDEIAGAVLNAIDRSENEQLGVNRAWLESVFVRRPWRRRGLGAALVARALEVLRDHGVTSAILGVDAENPTGALGLYERAGFRELTREAAWRKPMPAAAEG
jgi:ribosomal protein S18 acetylase RimI-like enzyme